MVTTEFLSASSILDYIFKELAISYLGRDDLSNQSSNQTTELLPRTGDIDLDTVGTAVPGDSYYGYTDGIHTVAIYGQGLIRQSKNTRNTSI